MHFVVALFGRDVDDFTLHIYASIAEQERKMIAERVRAAALIAKSEGRKFGLQLRPKSWQQYVSALGRAALTKEANERAEAYRLYIEWALGQPGRRGRLISFRGAAIKLNERNIETPLGGQWRGHHVQRMAARLKLNHPLARMPEQLARDGVRALFKQGPNLTAPEVLEPRTRLILVGHTLTSRSAVEMLRCEVVFTGESAGISIGERRLESALARCGSDTRTTRRRRS